MRATRSNDVTLDDVFVSDEDVVHSLPAATSTDASSKPSCSGWSTWPVASYAKTLPFERMWRDVQAGMIMPASNHLAAADRGERAGQEFRP